VTQTEVADGIVAVVSEPGTMGLSNSTVIRDGGTAMVVDTMLLPEMAQQIADVAAKLGGTVRTVLHTHHHADHCGGNSVFGGARIVAHAPTAPDIAKVLGEPDLLDKIMPSHAGRFATLGALVPEPVDVAELDIPWDGQALVFGPAHSFHDVALWFGGRRVLIAADLCFSGVTPLGLHGSLPGWAEALGKLIALEPEVVVPGHGPVTTAQTLADLRGYLLRLVAAAEDAVRTGGTVADALAEFDPGPVGDWLENGRTRLNMTKAIGEARDRAGYLPGRGPVPAPHSERKDHDVR
jgi:cyclase